MTIQRILDEKGSRLVTRSYLETIETIAKVLSAERIGAVILTDGVGKLAGILSERDIVRLFAENKDDIALISAENSMTRSVITCTVDTSIEDALAMMSAHAIRHIPVVREDFPLGLISIRDLIDFRQQHLMADLERSKQIQENLIQSHRQSEKLSRKLEEAAQYLSKARDEAEAASRAKSEFLASMSHELRTPLNAIVGFSQVIKAEELGPVGCPEYGEFVLDIHKAGLELLDLVNDILDFAKLESGDAEIEEEVAQISDVIRSAVTLVRSQATSGKVALKMEIDRDLPTLRADVRMISQILSNLLINAIKFTHAGGTVTVRADNGPEFGYRIQIVDTGVGIALDDIPKVLSEFGQVDSSLSRKYEGTGLGLPLARALVELHGGSFDLKSEVGVGTEVTIRFPETRVVGRDPNREPIADNRAA
jgi:signal transduction histidine kinase